MTYPGRKLKKDNQFSAMIRARRKVITSILNFLTLL